MFLTKLNYLLKKDVFIYLILRGFFNRRLMSFSAVGERWEGVVGLCLGKKVLIEKWRIQPPMTAQVGIGKKATWPQTTSPLTKPILTVHLLGKHCKVEPPSVNKKELAKVFFVESAS